MSLKQHPDNIKGKPEKRMAILFIPLVSKDVLRKWWEELEERLRHDPHYIPIKSIPKEEDFE